LPEMTVGVLAGHTARAVFTVETYLDAPPPGDAHPISPVDYFLSVVATPDWADLSSPLNTTIRARGEEQAADGHEALLSQVDQAYVRLSQRLRDEPGDRLLAVLNGQVIQLDDYLLTRMLEMVVHADDLATSVGLESAAIPAQASNETINLLVDIARQRHGDLAVLRALARRDRDAVQALRVL